MGARIAGQVARVLLYADDLALMAETPQQLQGMLDCLDEFCDACCMTVNVKKTEIVIFNRELAPVKVPEWTLKGHNIPVKPEFRYLGIFFAQDGIKGGVGGARDRQLRAAHGALHEMWRRCYALKLSNVRTLMYLYGALIQPIASYGCEVWAPSVLFKNGKIIQQGEQEVMQNNFMRQALGVRDTTSTSIVFEELNKDPMWMFWLRQCCKLWNRVIALPDTELIKQALLENVCMAVVEGNKSCWAYCFLQCMCALGVLALPSQVILEAGPNGMPIKLGSILLTGVDTAMRLPATAEWSKAQAAGPPRCSADAQHDGVKCATYAAWFRVDGGVNKNEAFTAHLKWRQQITAVARFRMGSHNLDIDARRWGQGQIARSQRICTCCDNQNIEDELHMVFECDLYHNERALFFGAIKASQESIEARDMKRVMNGDGSLGHWQAVAHFLQTCSKIRADKRAEQIADGIIPAYLKISM